MSTIDETPRAGKGSARRSPRLATLLLAACVLASCSESPSSGGGSGAEAEPPGLTTASAAPPDVVLVSIDTLRADHLGSYGYPKPTSPHLDRLAARGIVFDRAMAHAPSTLPSHVSIFTSTLPTEHRVMVATESPLPDDLPTVAEVFLDAGYRTAAFHSGGQLTDDLSIDRGFDEWVHVGEAFAPIVERGCEWLGTSTEPAFLFLHTYEIHHPYRPRPELLALFDDGYTGPLPPNIEIDDHLRPINGQSEVTLEIDDRDLAYIVATYDAELRSVDESIGRLVDCLEEQGRLDRTLFAITSDHGEEFGEHGWVGWHSHTLYDELLHVPLILRLPGDREAGRRVGPAVRSIDIAPTLLDVTGIPAPDGFRGRSLLPLALGEAPEARPADTVTISMRDHRGLVPGNISVRSPTHKLIGARLYDLLQDPRETVDVAAASPGVATALKVHRDAAITLARPIRSGLSEGESRLDEQTLEELRALGYLQ